MHSSLRSLHPAPDSRTPYGDYENLPSREESEVYRAFEVRMDFFCCNYKFVDERLLRRFSRRVRILAELRQSAACRRIGAKFEFSRRKREV